MNERDEANQSEQNQSEQEGATRPSTRAHLQSLLFNGAVLGTTLLTLATFLRGISKYPLEGGE